jgi:tRNA nucleotidyltransferase (CCA-adding enzyme)
VADVPVPRSELTRQAPEPALGQVPESPREQTAAARIAAAIPDPVNELIDTLVDAGFAAYIVGGSIRDVLIGRAAVDWDLATSARPDDMRNVFEDAAYENAFGTVAVRAADGLHEITTFRMEHDYADFRRPHRVEFGGSIETDLARRDFTVNALAWGREPGAMAALLVDPFGGLSDIDRRLLRAVGRPADRFGEDALRMLRVVRLASQLEFEVEPDTLAAVREHADLAAHLSGERVAAELQKLLAADRPSAGLRVMAETGLLDVVLPELAAQRGVAQNKVPGEDLWHHTLRSVDATPASRPVVRLAALLHDLGKPSTAADGHFYGHDVVGADLAEALLRRLHVPRETWERVVHLVRYHMFDYQPDWGDGAVRRFIAKIGPEALDELFALREADNVGSGLDRGASGLTELRDRIAAELSGPTVLDRRDLAIDGSDLIAELGLQPGPLVGRILENLLDRAVTDPTINTRPTLLLLAQGLAAQDAEA